MPDIPPEAVRRALAARAHALIDRPTPTALSDERLTEMMLEAAAPLMAAAERARIAADVEAQFRPPRGYGAFTDAWNTATSEILALLADPGHELAPLAELYQRVREHARTAPSTPRDYYQDGVAAERERIRQLAIRNGATCTSDEGTGCYFADLIGDQP